MPLHLHLVPLAGFAGLMAMAAFEDFRRLVIPNAVTLALCLLWPLHLATAATINPSATFGAVGCAAAVFIAGALLFSRGLMGGGDVKLLSAAALWAGPGMTPQLLVATAVLAWQGRLRPVGERRSGAHAARPGRRYHGLR